MVADGMTTGEILAEHPDLTREDIHEALISADTDFGSLLARSHSQSPSVVLIRRLIGRRAADQFEIIQANLPWVAEDLAAGAVVVIGDYRVRVRRLPLPG